MELNQRFRRLVRRVQSQLREKGFVAQGQTFWREREKLLQTIILKRSRWNTQTECEFWLIIGVFIPELYTIVYGESPPAYPKEGYLTISLEIDSIPFYPRQRETLRWQLRQEEPPEMDERLWLAITHHLQTYAVPFLERFETLWDVIEFLGWLRGHRREWFKWNQILPFDAWVPIYLAVLYWMVGDRGNCLRELEAFEKEETTAYIRERFVRVKEYLLSSF